jgi:hypothetical protein
MPEGITVTAARGLRRRIRSASVRTGVKDLVTRAGQETLQDQHMVLSEC